MPFFTDFEKAKAACKKVAKWGRAPEKATRTSKSKEKELEEANKRIAELEAQLKLKMAAA